MRNHPPAFTGLPVNRLQSCREEQQASEGTFSLKAQVIWGRAGILCRRHHDLMKKGNAQVDSQEPAKKTAAVS
jgi:hypothetical protein